MVRNFRFECHDLEVLLIFLRVCAYMLAKTAKLALERGARIRFEAWVMVPERAGFEWG